MAANTGAAAKPATTARPSRTRGTAPTKATTPKAETVKAETKSVDVTAEAAAVEASEPQVVGKLVLVKLPDTRSYSVFTPEEGSGFVGKLYAPLGTEVVKVLATK